MDLTITIITWNAKHFLDRCLQSILEGNSGISKRIILVDNGSTDGTVDLIEKKYKDVFLIKNPENRGVAPARNQALKEGDSRYVLILDVDTEIKPGSLEKMIKFMDEHPECGLLGPRLVSPTVKLQLSCRRFPNFIALFLRRLDCAFVNNSKLLREYLLQDWDHNTPREVDCVIGACQLIRKETLEKVGLLDDRMFYGWEDTDYCVRVHLGGYKVYYFPDAVVVHHEQRITKKRFFQRHTWEHIKSMCIYFSKYPWGLLGRYGALGTSRS